jgi:predicted GNAT family N-acyltransferase
MHNACKRYGLQVLQKLTQEFYIKEVTWSTHEAALRQIREEVFVVEQSVPENLEWDRQDADAIHLLALDDKAHPVACARIVGSTIGRMAVIKDKRGVGLGKALLASAIQVCKESNFKEIKLSSQTHAVQFYKKAGFVICGDPYLDANIWHVDMQLNI